MTNSARSQITVGAGFFERSFKTVSHPRFIVAAIGLNSLFVAFFTLRLPEDLIPNKSVWAGMATAGAVFCLVFILRPTRLIAAVSGTFLAGSFAGRGVVYLEVWLHDPAMSQSEEARLLIIVSQWSLAAYLIVVLWRRVIIPWVATLTTPWLLEGEDDG